MPRGGARPGAGRKPKARPVDAGLSAPEKPSFTANGVQTESAPANWPFGTKPPAEPAVPPDEPAAEIVPVLEEGLTALDYFQRIYRNQAVDAKVRFQAAIQALPYEVAKPGVTGKKAAKDEAAKKAHSRFAPSAPPKLAAVAGRKV